MMQPDVKVGRYVQHTSNKTQNILVYSCRKNVLLAKQYGINSFLGEKYN